MICLVYSSALDGGGSTSENGGTKGNGGIVNELLKGNLCDCILFLLTSCLM